MVLAVGEPVFLVEHALISSNRPTQKAVQYIGFEWRKFIAFNNWKNGVLVC